MARSERKGKGSGETVTTQIGGWGEEIGAARIRPSVVPRSGAMFAVTKLVTSPKDFRMGPAHQSNMTDASERPHICPTYRLSMRDAGQSYES